MNRRHANSRLSSITFQSAIGIFTVGTLAFSAPPSLGGHALDSVVGLLRHDYRACVNYSYDKMKEAGYTADPGRKMQTSLLVRLYCLDLV